MMIDNKYLGQKYVLFCLVADWQRKCSVGFCLFRPGLKDSAAGKLVLLLTGTLYIDTNTELNAHM